MIHRLTLTVLICVPLSLHNTHAFASPVSNLIESLARYAAKGSGSESAEMMTREVGEAVLERVATKVANEGGEESMERVSTFVTKYGPDVIHAIDNSPSARPILNALDELPAEQVPMAVARLAAGSQGRELAQTAARHGVAALRAEIVHPGVGRPFRSHFGKRRRRPLHGPFDRSGDRTRPIY